MYLPTYLAISTRVHTEDSFTTAVAFEIVLNQTCVSKQCSEVLGAADVFQGHQSCRSLGQVQYLPFGKVRDADRQKGLIRAQIITSKSKRIGREIKWRMP